jgi:SAM-dependent methyltransferase
MPGKENVEPAQVELLYRALLRRQPESKNIVQTWCKSGMSLSEIADTFFRSEEFKPQLVRLGLGGMLASDRSNHEAMPVQVDLNPQDLARVLRHVKAEWEQVGIEDPHWSVLSDDRFRSEDFAVHEQEFFESGREDVRKMILALERSGRSLTKETNVLELGCGVGRVTHWLAEQFQCIRSYDISAPHLSLAEEHLRNAEIDNVSLVQLTDASQLETESGIDLFFSILVLQHNPPPVAKALLVSAFNSLAEGGLAYFQIPTYMPGYSFDAERYLSGEDPSGGIEMHLIPQPDIFKICEEAGCRPLEVREDDYAGNTYFISNTFLVEKQ